MSWGLAAVVLAVPPLVLLTAYAATTTSTTTRVVALATIAQLLLVLGATVKHERRRTRQLWLADQALELSCRAELAEAALDREQERLHELRATVVGITMSHRLLHDRRDELADRTRSRLERLHEAELARLERLLADRPQEQVGDVDLGTVVDPLVDSLRLRGHRVRWEGTHHLASGRADDVAEVVHVLLENAARHGAGHDIEVGVVPRGDRVDVRVRDLGPGVPPALVPSLFERGTRGPDSPGQGIGLHIARRLAVEMGGELRLDSAHRTGGAAFVLTLPTPVEAPSCLAHSG